MNVLVYEGPGVSEVTLLHTLSTLRALLAPNYVVQTVSPQILATHPWQENCAALILPGGRDLPYISSLAPSSDKIKTYVRTGGKFIGICAGAYYACRRVEWEVGTSMEVSGDRPLHFFPGIGRGCVYPGFCYNSEAGARIVTLGLRGGEELEGVYYNGGGEFVGAEKIRGVTVLATYLDSDAAGKVAGVVCEVGAGAALLWAVHPEYPFSQPPASLALDKVEGAVSAERVRKLENQRWKLVRTSLALLGLQFPAEDEAQAIRPLPQFLVRFTHNADTLLELVQVQAEGSVALEDSQDTFVFHPYDGCDDLLAAARSAAAEQASTRHVVLCPEDVAPQKVQTPLFDIAAYHTALKTTSDGGNMGESLLYGEVVTSTQTLLDKNPRFLSLMPSPLLSLASYQVAGRGRGSNTWLSPTGCLQFSLLLRVPLTNFPASRLVFVQYLFGLAVAEACRSESVLGSLGERVRLKWPNDIYAFFGSDAYKKIGGILVNTSFRGGQVDIIIGCGLNVLCRSPMYSLSRLVGPGYSKIELSLERTTAAIMATFEPMWDRFLSMKGSFDPFMDQYLEHWLHSDQVVRLTTTEPHTEARIVGITADHGFLRTLPTSSSSWSHRGEPFIDLQPDGNSFDMMSGLIRAK